MNALVHPAVARALSSDRPVVALESTLICHGLPRPRNLDLAHAVQDAVRAEGVVPATVALVDGRVRVGLDDATLARLATADGVAKCSPRDLPVVRGRGERSGGFPAAEIVVARRIFRSPLNGRGYGIDSGPTAPPPDESGCRRSVPSG